MSLTLDQLQHRITLQAAQQMIRTYGTHRAGLEEKPDYGIVLPLSETFNRQAFEELLSKPGCKGIRLYYGMDETGQLRAIFVAVDENEADLLPAEAGVADGSIIEVGKICPPDCAGTMRLAGTEE